MTSTLAAMHIARKARAERAARDMEAIRMNRIRGECASRTLLRVAAMIRNGAIDEMNTADERAKLKIPMVTMTGVQL